MSIDPGARHHDHAAQGAEAAMEWLLSRADDTSLDEDFTEEEAQVGGGRREERSWLRLL